MHKNKFEGFSTPPADHQAADPQAKVEMMHITEYLKSKGYSLEQLADLPKAEAKALMEEASQYASLHLTELEMGAAFVNALHHDAAMTTTTSTIYATVEQSPE
jgi:hypothetical protein